MAGKKNLSGMLALDGRSMVLTAAAGILVLPFTILDVLAADTVNDWSTGTFTNLETGGTNNLTTDGITVTTTGSVVGGRASDTLTVNPTITQNTYVGVIDSALDANVDDESVYNQIDFSFSEPVYNLRFRAIDNDGFNDGSAQFFTDKMTFTSDAGVPTSGVVGSLVTYTTATGTAITNNTINCSGADARCYIDVTFTGPVNTAQVRHIAAAVSGTNNPSNQAIQIYDLTFNTPPDATNNANTVAYNNTVSGNVLSDNDGFGVDFDRQDGTNNSVNQFSHPDSTVTVGAGSTTLTLANGATLVVAQDGSYTFNPNGAYNGLGSGATATETFTYRIEDQEGLFNTGGDVPNPDSVATLVLTITGPGSPSYTFNKVADKSSVTTNGETITYTMTLSNTGTADITGVSLSDVLSQSGSTLGLTSGPTLSGDTDSDNILDQTEVWVYTATYDVTQGNLDDGNDIVNVATISSNELASVSDNAATSTPGPIFACSGDNFASANPISGASGSTPCSTTGATGETGEPLTFGGGALETIWYEWVAPATGTATFDTCNTAAYDTTLGIYTGSAVNALTTIGTNDDGPGCSGFSSSIDVAVVSGTTYYIQVGGYGNADGDFTLNWDMENPQASITKSASTIDIAAPGTITYTMIVDNIGNVDLTTPTLNDTLTQNGSGLTLTSGPTLSSGDTDSDGVLDQSETWIYTASYDATSANILDGNDMVNSATFSSAEAANVSDNATTSISFTPAPSLLISKIGYEGGVPVSMGGSGTAAAADRPVGTVITYVYTVTNDGNTIIDDITIGDIHNGSGGAVVPTHFALTDNGTTGDSPDGNASASIWGTLAPSDVITFTGTYTVTQSDVDTL